ncbi:MAG: sigma-70 family RNA polymerase sigma factor [Phycisphaerae bacterium]
MATPMTTSSIPKRAPASFPTAKPPGDATIRRLPPEDQVLLTKLLTEPVDYVDHPDFDRPGTEKALFGETAKLVGRAATRFAAATDAVTATVTDGVRRPALTSAEETHLFMRFNFARMRVARILGEFAGRRLSVPATRRLLAWGHRVLATRSIIVRLNMPLVLAMGKRTRLTNIDFNEMVSEGNMALLRSVEKFDCSRGFKFSTYSCRAILKAFSRVAMRVSRYRGQFPTEFDPAMERSDHLDHCRRNIEEDCVDELKDILLQNLAGLSEVESTVIRERFALGKPLIGEECGPKTLEQVGHIIGVTKERVRQIQNNALRKIRHTLEDRYLAA